MLFKAREPWGDGPEEVATATEKSPREVYIEAEDIEEAISKLSKAEPKFNFDYIEKVKDAKVIP